jgi:ssDNA thymidine ADP-ribosyltransferase, DarT
MDRRDLLELHCIAPIANLASIASLGILSHNQAAQVDHLDVSDAEVQDRRKGKLVPDARRSRPRELHDYANLYICGRNPMMYVRRDHHDELVMLRVSCEVLDLDEVVISDGNASSNYTGFQSAPGGLGAINETITFAGDPTHPNVYEFYDRKRRQCAEVLVPNRILPEYITGAYASCEESRDQCAALGLPWHITVDPKMFFQT